MMPYGCCEDYSETNHVKSRVSQSKYLLHLIILIIPENFEVRNGSWLMTDFLPSLPSCLCARDRGGSQGLARVS